MTTPNTAHLLRIISRLDAIENDERCVMDDDGIPAMVDLSDARDDIRALVTSHAELLDALLFARHVMEGNGLHRSTDWPSGYPALWSAINAAIARATQEA